MRARPAQPKLNPPRREVPSTPQLMDTNVMLTDPDDKLDGGTLTISGLLAKDMVASRDQGTGAGVSAGIVTFAGMVIGTRDRRHERDAHEIVQCCRDGGGDRGADRERELLRQPIMGRALKLKVSDAEGITAIATITMAERPGAAQRERRAASHRHARTGAELNQGSRREPVGMECGHGDLD